MRFTEFALFALTAASANAAPHPQQIDFKALNPITKPAQTVPDGITAQVVTYNPTAAASSAAAAVSQVSAVQGYSSNSKRTVKQLKARDGDCSVQPATIYTGPNPADDRHSFLEYQPFADAANSALTPAGYTRSFVNLRASNNALKYMGFTQFSTYDTISCASKCSDITGCNSFNIYFERDPIVNPGLNCTNPPSMTNLKCVFWGSSIDASTAVNDGQWRSKFQVAIAGSNGYNLATLPTPTGYTPPTCLEDSAINAPLDCNGDDTFLGSRFFTDTPFDISLCTAACDATTSYDLSHPPASGSPKTCQFINTYVLYLNGVAQGQACAMYTESWDSSYATNTGYTSGSDVYTIRSSYTVSNSVDPNYAKDCRASKNSHSSSISSTSTFSILNDGTSISTTVSSTSVSATLSTIGYGDSYRTQYGSSSTILYGSIVSSGISSSSSVSDLYPTGNRASTTVESSTSAFVPTTKTGSSATITSFSSILSTSISNASLSSIGYGSLHALSLTVGSQSASASPSSTIVYGVPYESFLTASSSPTKASSAAGSSISSGLQNRSSSTLVYGSTFTGGISSSSTVSVLYPNSNNATITTSSTITVSIASTSTVSASNTNNSSTIVTTKSSILASAPISEAGNSISSKTSSTVEYGASSTAEVSAASKSSSSSIEYGYPYASFAAAESYSAETSSTTAYGPTLTAQSSLAPKFSSSSIGYGYPYASFTASESSSTEAASTIPYESSSTAGYSSAPRSSSSTIVYGPTLTAGISSAQSSPTDTYESPEESFSGAKTSSVARFSSVSASPPTLEYGSPSSAESYSSPSSIEPYSSSTTGLSSAFVSSSTAGSGSHYSLASSTTIAYGSSSTPQPSSPPILSTVGYESSSIAVPVSYITVTSVLGCTCASATSSATLAPSEPQGSFSINSSSKSANSSDPVTSSNLGINFAYFKDPISNTGYGSPEFDATSFDAKNSFYDGTSSQIGFSNTAPGSNVTLYSGAPSCSVEKLAIIHTGFVYARQAGKYTFTITAADDIVMGWIGSNAYASYSVTNADVIAASYSISRTITTVSKTLTTGDFLPFKVLWANGANNGNLGFTIQGPDSTLLSSVAGSAKDIITTAPSGTQEF